MKKRTYRTIDGETVVALRPENAAEAAALETDIEVDGRPLDARHSLGDGREDEDTTEETTE